jgi:two-component system sensor histidine kinase ChvG
LQFALLVAVFVAVPVILYRQFEGADQGKKALLLRSVQEQGWLIAEAMRPVLSGPTPPALPIVGRELSKYGVGEATLRILFQPANVVNADGFYYVASVPRMPTELLESERDELQRQGVLDRLNQTCAGDIPVALNHVAPDGREDVVTSVTPIRSPHGCWAVITSYSALGTTGSIIGQSYWKSREVQIAAMVYLGLALLILTMFISLWAGLSRFATLARRIRKEGMAGPSFGARNLLPELAGVAREFDRLVETLRDSAHAIRRAAEDNSHAFKTPLATIRQSLEPLKRLTPAHHERGQRAQKLIERSLDRLDELVAQARRFDEATADLIDVRLADIDLSATVKRMLDAYEDIFTQRGLTLVRRVEGGLFVHANTDLIETVMENVVDNAVDFSPPGARVEVVLARFGTRAEMTVTDDGPGVAPTELARVFDRYFSSRPSPPDAEGNDDKHFGLGLWIVRRNVENIGGTVVVENAAPRGFRVRITLPLGRPGRQQQDEDS